MKIFLKWYNIYRFYFYVEKFVYEFDVLRIIHNLCYSGCIIICSKMCKKSVKIL